jgi:hypothetical protein
MDDPARIKRALGQVLPDSTPVTDPYDDLARARSALRARSRRRLRLGLGALALVVVAGGGVAAALERTAEPDGSAPAVASARIHLVAMRLDAKPYSFDLTPNGWSVQAQNAYFVTIVPDDGSAPADPDVFIGKLVITYDHEPFRGRLAAGGARPVRIGTGSGYTTLSMRTAAGEPAGVVRIQYPDHAGWDRSAMVRFVRSVHVGAGAKPSLG